MATQNNAKNNTQNSTVVPALVHVSTTISKLGPSIPTVNLPPVVTCRKNAPCCKMCYAVRGNFRYQNVVKSLATNLRAYQENPTLYFDMIAQSFMLSMYARFHSSGDIVDMEYLAGMCRVARKCKRTEILAFTKKFELVNEYVASGHRIPKNLHIVFSTWADFMPDNPYNFPMTYVRFKDEAMNKNIPGDAIQCSGKCDKCLGCWQLKKGQSVVFKKH